MPTGMPDVSSIVPSMLLLLARTDATSCSLPLSSASSSSSVIIDTGFCAPPMAVFAATSRVIVSSMRVRIEPPGGASWYCFANIAAYPLTPPKYTISCSRSSAECGTLAPPVPALSISVLHASRSIFSRASRLRLAARLVWSRWWFRAQSRQRFFPGKAAFPHPMHSVAGRLLIGRPGGCS
jgi:hypothetical protein